MKILLKSAHIIDKESEIPSHKEEFKKSLDKMKEAGISEKNLFLYLSFI